MPLGEAAVEKDQLQPFLHAQQRDQRLSIHLYGAAIFLLQQQGKAGGVAAIVDHGDAPAALAQPFHQCIDGDIVQHVQIDQPLLLDLRVLVERL